MYCGTSVLHGSGETVLLDETREDEHVRVVFPDPVSPRRMVTSLSRIWRTRASLPGESHAEDVIGERVGFGGRYPLLSGVALAVSGGGSWPLISLVPRQDQSIFGLSSLVCSILTCLVIDFVLHEMCVAPENFRLHELGARLRQECVVGFKTKLCGKKTGRVGQITELCGIGYRNPVTQLVPGILSYIY